MPPRRRRASAIVERPEGILLVLMRHMGAMLPGGGIKPFESDGDAAARELLEETGLVAERVVFLFERQSLGQSNAVFWVRAQGVPKPCNEIDQIAYYPPREPLRLAPETQSILHQFAELRAREPGRFAEGDEAT